MKQVTIGVFGVAGVGKSFVSDYLVEAYDFDAICLDTVGHQVLKEATVKKWLHSQFGARVFEGETVNRKVLGQIVFHDASKLECLNAFVHPILVERAKHKIMQSQKNTVINGALLQDFCLDAYCDCVIGLQADFADIANFAGVKQWKISAAQDHILDQVDQAEIVLNNTFDERTLFRQLDLILKRYLDETFCL